MASKSEFHVSTMLTALVLLLAGVGYTIRFFWRLAVGHAKPAQPRRNHSASRLMEGFDPTPRGGSCAVKTGPYVQHTGRVRRAKRRN